MAKVKINISTSASDSGFSKGDRIIARLDKNEWLTGEVTRAGAKLGIKFDDGSTATVDPEDFKDVKLLTTPKKSKKPLTDAEAKPLFAKVKKAKTEKAEKPTKVKKVKIEPATEMYMAYNHNGTELMKEPGTKAEAQKEMREYKKQTGNRAYIELVQGKPAKAEKEAKGGKSKKVKVDVSAIPGKKPAKTTTADVTPDTSYEGFIAKLTKEKASKRIEALKAKIESMRNRGMRAARRAEDAGPMDIMWERIQPLEIEQQMLEWYLKNPKKAPAKELMSRYAESVLDTHRSKQYKAAKKEKLAQFPNLIGWTIEFKAKGGRSVSAVVLKQLPGKWSDAPRYKAQEPGMAATWTVPDALVTKKTKPKDLDNVLGAIAKKADAKKKAASALQAGQEVSWVSKKRGRGLMQGKVASVGRTGRVKVQVEGQFGTWTVPLSFITSVDGKPFKFDASKV